MKWTVYLNNTQKDQTEIIEADKMESYTDGSLEFYKNEAGKPDENIIVALFAADDWKRVLIVKE